MKKVLACSGGGMRGAITTQWLVEIEKVTGKRIFNIFDFIAGTSTGSILTACLTSPKNLSAQDVLDFYYKSGPNIFHSSLLSNLEVLWAPKYTNDGLINELKNVVGESYNVGDVNKNIFIPTVNSDTVDMVFIKSYDALYKDFPLWAAAAASASAQTFFPAFNYNGVNHIDGGNGMNNPCAGALFEAMRLWPDEEIVLVSLGTGYQNKANPLPTNGGLMNWMSLLFNELSDLQTDVFDSFCRFVSDDKITYIKIDVPIGSFGDMDVADKDTLDGYVSLANSFIENNPETWQTLLSYLNK